MSYNLYINQNFLYYLNTYGKNRRHQERFLRKSCYIFVSLIFSGIRLSSEYCIQINHIWINQVQYCINTRYLVQYITAEWLPVEVKSE